MLYGPAFHTFTTAHFTAELAPAAVYVPSAPDPLMNLTESAKILGVSFRKLKEIIKAGLLKPDPILGRIRLSVIRNYGK